MYVFLPTYRQEAFIQAQKCRRQRTYNQRMLQNVRSNIGRVRAV